MKKIKIMKKDWVLTGEVHPGENEVDAARRILKENNKRNRGEFIVALYTQKSVFITEYSNGIRFAKGAVVWLSYNELKEICKGVQE